MRILMIGLSVAVSLAATGALAQDACASLDKGNLYIGQVLTQAQQQQLMAAAPLGTLHCGRTGCWAQAQDGVNYRWGRDGRIVGKKVEMSAPVSLPGWRGEIDRAFADRLGQATCSSFTVFEDDLDGGRSMKSAPQSTAQGQTIVASLFGRGTEDDPLTIEMLAVEQ